MLVQVSCGAQSLNVFACPIKLEPGTLACEMGCCTSLTQWHYQQFVNDSIIALDPVWTLVLERMRCLVIILESNMVQALFLFISVMVSAQYILVLCS